MNWCILIPLLVGLISALLGYLLGKLAGNNTTNNNDVEEYKLEISRLKTALEQSRKNQGNVTLANNLAASEKEEYEWKLKFKNLESDFDAYKKSKESLEVDLADCKKSHKSLEDTLDEMKKGAINLIAFDANAAKAVFGKKIKQDDLTLIEGIGPKIQELFHNHEVKTWKELSECSIEKCQEVLNSGGERFKIHIPTTWPEQARMAYEGLWQKLSDWQDKLDGGREVE